VEIRLLLRLGSSQAGFTAFRQSLQQFLQQSPAVLCSLFISQSLAVSHSVFAILRQSIQLSDSLLHNTHAVSLQQLVLIITQQQLSTSSSTQQQQVSSSNSSTAAQ
jgi:hypothetical protein